MKSVSIPLVLSSVLAVPVLGLWSRASGAESPEPPAPAAAQPQVTETAPSAAPSAPALVAPAAASRVAPNGFAVELTTGGLSGAQGGALGLGFSHGRMAAGVAIDFRRASLVGPDFGDNRAELTTSAVAVGPWLRVGLVRALDGRVDLDGALDFQYGWQSATANIDSSPTNNHASASGVILRVGPGIRFWATPWIAVGYMTQLSWTNISGPLLAFTQSTTLAPSTYEFSNNEVSLVGRFSVLAVF